jgi:hypothetical protein
MACLTHPTISQQQHEL